MNVLLPVSLEELRGVWPDVRDRIAAIAARFDQPWIAEDVFHELVVGNSHLWVSEDRTLFAVLRVFATMYERTLHVWVAGNDGPAPMEAYLEAMKAIAADNACSKITWESDRKYRRALPGVKVTYAYSIEVGD